MRILAIAHTVPWPQTSGARMRMANILQGLSRAGEIDLVALTNHPAAEPLAPPAGVRLRRAVVLPRPMPRASVLVRAAWLAAGSLPSDLGWRDYGPVRREFRRHAEAAYDLVWFSRLESYAVFGDLVRGPAVVDVDDLEDMKIERFAALRRGEPRPDAAPGAVRAVRRLVSGRNVRLWRRLQLATAARADAVVVCSDTDRERLAEPNVHVIPNGYDAQERPAGRVEVGAPPVIGFPGYLLYPPNVEAAHHLVRRIAPVVRRAMPSVQVRLIGAADDRVVRLHDPPRVVVTGFVPQMAPELARVDLVAVPVRFGGGTRIKILEAFAHRIPVVSTTVGAEGLGVTDGRELLLRDTPETFAEACVALLSDVRARAGLVEAAHALFAARYRWDHIHPMVEALARDVAARRRAAAAPVAAVSGRA